MINNSSRHYDIVLVGSGVMGSAIAYNLIKQDARLKIALVEKDKTFEKSSTILSDGNTRVQFNLSANIKISLYGLKVLETFAAEMRVEGQAPIDFSFRQQGNLFIIDEKGVENAKRGVKTQLEHGAEVKWLEPAQVQDIYPVFNPSSCTAGTFGPKDGTMSPLDILQGYRRKAIALGVYAIDGEVETFLQEGGQMQGVRLASGDILKSPIVVNTAGVWATDLLKAIGVNLPIKSIKRQVYSIASDAHYENILPMLLLPTGQYVLHEGGSHFVTGGASLDDPETVTDFSWNKERFEENFWEGLVHFIPSFDRLKVLNGWAGLYAVNHFDGNAILGEWPEIKGLYLANGFSGHGFQQCHGVGRYIADTILGSSLELDLSILGPRRILDNAPVFENPARLI
ncbi:MAG: FAD-dependent oxidoreductase domain-containing protein 1 [Candidatus Promineifilaceae bacterium]|jgi:FAD-dependent oxidoreductase domain-containing protein 1